MELRVPPTKYFVVEWHLADRLHLLTTSLYFTLHYYTTALLPSTLAYITPPWLYFTLHYSSMALLDSTRLYFTLHYSTIFPLYVTVPWLYFTVLYSTMALLHST